MYATAESSPAPLGETVRGLSAWSVIVRLARAPFYFSATWIEG